MCTVTVARVKQVGKGRAVMEDGRVVGLGSLKDVHVGDTLSVYADIAIEKICIEKESS